jgi:predicted nucleic acid-binding protein
MNLIVDANILFSALYKPASNAGDLLLHAIEGDVVLFSTEHVYAEMKRIVQEKLDYSSHDAWDVINHLPIEWLEIDIYREGMDQARKYSTDVSDSSLIALSILSGYDIVTGDKHLLSSRCPGIRIRKLKDVVDDLR